MLVVFPLDPCFDRAVGPLATSDYTYDIAQPNLETITELTAD